MEIKEITNYNDFLTCRNEWNELIERIDHPEVFYLYEWVDNYIKYYEPELKERLFIIKIYDEGVIALFPFVIIDGILTFITRYASDYNIFYIDSNCNKFSIIKKAFEYLLNHREVRSILLINVPASSELYYMLEVLRELNYSAFLQESVITPYFKRNHRRIDRRQKNHIKDIERRERRLKEFHEVEYSHSNIIKPDEWDFIIKCKTERYQGAQIANKNVQEFYKGIADDMKEYISADTMYVNNDLMAAHFGFLYKGKLYYYMPAFQQSEIMSGMGLMLLNDMINCNDYETFDSLIGNEGYKFFWCDETSMNFHLMAYKKGKGNYMQKMLISLKNTQFIRKIFGR